MASLSPATDEIMSTKHVFTTFTLGEPPDQPCDLTLVAEDGKEFKAHRQILSEASQFFEKLLNSDMKESKEGTVRLEVLAASAMGDILEFIYTGSVQISSADHAQDMIAMADYLLLPRLKSFAGRELVPKLNVSNCISYHYFAKRYRCQELTFESSKFILENILAVAKTEEFLNLSSEELKMWISSDEINVTAEEDAFKLGLAWIYHDKNERKRYFAELFGHVRLIYISRDYLIRNVVTNELVKDNEGCLDLVNKVVNLIDFNSSMNVCDTPRKSLKSSVIVISTVEQENILCYYPREDKWYKCPDRSPPAYNSLMFSCYGKLYFLNEATQTISRCESFSNRWSSLRFNERRYVNQFFVRNEDEIYALVSDDQVSCKECVALIRSRGIDQSFEIERVEGNTLCGRKHLSAITKYKPESNVWEDISSFDLGSRMGCCIVAKDNFIYLIGGVDNSGKIMNNADRYDLIAKEWGKIVDIQEGRAGATGAVAYGKIFIAGGIKEDNCTLLRTCEVYDETTNEWHYIESLPLTGPLERLYIKMMCVDGSLFVVGGYFYSAESDPYITIHCYDPLRTKWSKKAELPMERIIAMPRSQQRQCSCRLRFCSMRIFKESNLYKSSSPLKFDNLRSSFCSII